MLDVEVVILGGGLGVRLGKPYADKIAAAMLPHLFNDDRPPPVLVAALGDLGGALGASLLTPAGRRRRLSAPRARQRPASCAAFSSSSSTSAKPSPCSVTGSVSMPRAASSPAIRSHACRRTPRRRLAQAQRHLHRQLEAGELRALDAQARRRRLRDRATRSPAPVEAKRQRSTFAKSGSPVPLGAQRRDRADVAHARRGLRLRIVGWRACGAQR